MTVVILWKGYGYSGPSYSFLLFLNLFLPPSWISTGQQILYHCKSSTESSAILCELEASALL